MRTLPVTINNTASQAGIRDYIIKEGVYLTSGRFAFNTALDRTIQAAKGATLVSPQYTVPLGRVLWLQGITVSSDRPIRISGRINHGQHQGATNLNGTTELFGGSCGKLSQQWDIKLDKLMFEGGTIAFTIYTSEPGLENPFVEIFINGMEATNDLNYAASNTILVAGDSITHWGLGNDADGFPYCGKDLYASRLANRLTKLGYSTRVVNKGVRGSTTREGKFGLIDGFYDGIDYSLLVIGYGTNDARLSAPIPLPEVKANLKAFIDWRNAYQPSKPILIMAPGSTDKTDYVEQMNTYRSAIVSYANDAAIGAGVSNGVYCVDASAAFGLTTDPTLDDNFQTTERSATNRLHWSGKGHSLVESLIWNTSAVQSKLLATFKKS